MGRRYILMAVLVLAFSVLGACSNDPEMSSTKVDAMYACNRQVTADASTNIAKVSADTLPVQTWGGDSTKYFRALEDWQAMVIKRSARTGDKVNKGDTLVVPEICPKGTAKGSYITATASR